MSYIGQRPVVGRYIKLDQISSGFNGSNTGFSMTAGSQAVFPGTARNLLLSLGGVIQEPDTDFTISGSTLTFTTPPVANTTFFGVIYGDMQATGTPSDGTVLPASIATSGNFSFPEITITGDLNIADKIIHSGDTDTALRFPANNTISAETSGNEVLRLDSSGRILIGKTSNRQTRLGTNSFSPDIQFEDETIGAISMTRLSDNNAPPRFILQKTRGSIASPAAVVDNDLVGQILFSGFDGSNFCNTAQIRSEVDGTPGTNDMPGNLLFMTTSDGSTTTLERMRIDSNGRIGIGKSSPVAALDLETVDNVTAHFKSTDDGANIDLSDNDTRSRFRSVDGFLNIYADFDNNVSNSAIRFFVDASNEKVRITDTGRVGIGTVSPDVNFHVSANSSVAKIESTASATSARLIIKSANDTYTGLHFGDDGDDDVGRIRYYHTNNHMHFSTGASERMRIDSSGVLSIGTTSPNGSASKLQVEDSGENNVYFVGNTTTSGARLILQNKNTTANSFTGVLGADGGGQTTASINFYSADNDNNEGYLTLETRPSGGNPTERMRISSTGNVGINSDANGPDRLLHVSDVNNAGVATLFRLTNAAGSAGTEVRMEFECGLDEIAYIGAKHEGSDTGPLTFATASSQGAYPTEKMRLTKNGDLLIGTTSEVVDTSVHIDGNIAIRNTSTGLGTPVKTFVLSKSYTMSTSSTDILTFDNWGTAAFDITVFRNDTVSPAGANVTKVYLAFHGSGQNITQASIVQDSKVTRGSIHTVTYGISENNNTATLTATGDDNNGEAQSLTFFIIGRGNNNGSIVVA